MTTTLTLDAVRVQFGQWRQHKRSPQCRVPVDLRDKAVALCDHYSDREITKTLKIPPARFQSWRTLPLPPAKGKTHSPQFATVPPELIGAAPEPLNPSLTAIEFTCSHPNGMQWQLQGQFSPQQLAAILSTLSSSGGLS